MLALRNNLVLFETNWTAMLITPMKFVHRVVCAIPTIHFKFHLRFVFEILSMRTYRDMCFSSTKTGQEHFLSRVSVFGYNTIGQEAFPGSNLVAIQCMADGDVFGVHHFVEPGNLLIRMHVIAWSRNNHDLTRRKKMTPVNTLKCYCSNKKYT